MDYKFIVLALVISVATGEETLSRKLESPISSNKSLEIIKSTEQQEIKSNLNEKLSPVIANVSHNMTVIHNNSIDTATESSTTKGTTPAPGETKWRVLNSNGSVCIIAKMELEFNITYTGPEKTKISKTIVVPQNASASGNCSCNTTQKIELKWGKGNYFEIGFRINKTTEKFDIEILRLTVNMSGFDNFTEDDPIRNFTKKNPKFPATPVTMSYKCDRQQKQVLNDTSNSWHAVMFISHTQLEAFMSKKDAMFGEAKDCDEFDTPDIVPVAVGCVLSILVLIVLAAYLIGRKRSQNRGYLSM